MDRTSLATRKPSGIQCILMQRVVDGGGRFVFHDAQPSQPCADQIQFLPFFNLGGICEVEDQRPKRN
jgi:hypothetical protein